jgi:hypothetical protein
VYSRLLTLGVIAATASVATGCGGDDPKGLVKEVVSAASSQNLSTLCADLSPDLQAPANAGECAMNDGTMQDVASLSTQVLSSETGDKKATVTTSDGDWLFRKFDDGWRVVEFPVPVALDTGQGVQLPPESESASGGDECADGYNDYGSPC